MTEPFHRSIRSFVIRQGRMTPAQLRAFDEHGEQFLLDVTSWDPHRLFVKSSPVVIEIGFGMGKSLASQAELTPEENFIGIEVHRPGIGSLLLAADRRSLTNLKIVEGDALDLLELLPRHSIQRVQVFFPDPWPKKKHHKRRLVNSSFLDAVAGILESGGVLHLATDWQPYAEEIKLLLSARPDFTPAPLLSRQATKYEARGERLGHDVTDLVFRRTT